MKNQSFSKSGAKSDPETQSDSKTRIGFLRKKFALPTLITLLGFAVGGAAFLTSTPSQASSSTHFSISRSYFSNPARTNLVGYWTCDCQGEENLVWGQQTPFFTEDVTGFCPPF